MLCLSLRVRLTVRSACTLRHAGGVLGPGRRLWTRLACRLARLEEQDGHLGGARRVGESAGWTHALERPPSAASAVWATPGCAVLRPLPSEPLIRCAIGSVPSTATSLRRITHLPEVEIDEVLRLVGHVRAEVAPHNAVPGRVVLLVELLLDVRRDVLLDVVLLESLRRLERGAHARQRPARRARVPVRRVGQGSGFVLRQAKVQGGGGRGGGDTRNGAHAG